PHLDAELDWYGDDIERGIAELVSEATSVRFDGSDLMPGEVGAGSFWTGMTDYFSGTADMDTVLAEIDASWPEDGEEPAEEAEEEAEDLPQLVIWADENRAEIIEDLGQAFKEEYDIEIVVQQLGFGDIRDNLKVAGPAGEGPDIIIGAHDWLGELVASGLLAPIELGDKLEEFVPSAIQAFTYEGELYGMPYAIENLAFFRNPDLVPEVPADWDEVAQIAADLEEAGEVQNGYVLQEGDPYHFFPIQTAFGGYVFGQNEDGTYNADDVGIDSEGSIAAATWLDTMVKEGHMEAGWDYDTVHAMFESGDAAMLITGPWALERLQEAGANYEISAIPGDGKPFLGVQGFMVSAFSEQPLIAQAFLTEYVATTEVMMDLYEVGNRAPAMVEAQALVEDPDIAAFGVAGLGGLPMPAIPEMSAVWTAWGDAVTLIFQQQEAPEAAFENAAEQIRTTIAEGE
ncbi:MAG: extracellular solute-binding protein, partial [Chitinivibrionales bacterium]|nr:extracellular solute-binding protein [Chitinivibrionales bacterium]